MTDKERILAAIGRVEHPAIALPLVELGMVRDVSVGDEGVSFTLVVPFLGIPEMVRNAMIEGVRGAVESTGASVAHVSVTEMTEPERREFLAKEQAHWRG